MATNATQLASEIATALGHPGNITTQVQGFATGILEELTQNGVAGFGMIPGPYSISGMTGPSMATKVANYAGYGYVTPTLSGYCTGIVTHIQSVGIVTYSGPGGLAGYFLGGTISGINGSGMATAVAAAAGYPYVSTQLLAKCTAIANHIIANAQVTSGTIA